MKRLIGIVLFSAMVLGLTSCFNTTVQKPKKLIPKDKFIKMMVDVYLIEGLNNGSHNVKELKKITSTDLYYSMLKKYSVADTVFIRSLIYYSSFPREYEKMHIQIMDILKQSEMQFKPKEKLNMQEK